MICESCQQVRRDLPQSFRDAASLAAWPQQQHQTVSDLTSRMNALAARLNSLPVAMLPAWLADIDDRTVREHAAGVPRCMDHGNAAGSAVLLAMLKPLVFSEIPRDMAVPLRIFGEPPECLLEYQDIPRSSLGADNRRGNVMEALSLHFHTRDAELCNELQEVWILARAGCDQAAEAMGLHTYSAWQVVRPMQQLVPRVLHVD